MRSHADVIKTAKGPDDDKAGAHALARLLHPHVGGDLIKLQGRIRAWLLTDSIPGEYWSLLERLGVGEVNELASYAEARRLRPKTHEPSNEHRGEAAA